MEAVQALMREHRAIENVLGVLQREVERLRAGAARDVAGVEAVLAFLDTFESGLHHEKEDVLFAALRRSGTVPSDGPLGIILDEHIRGKALRAEIRSALARVGEEGPPAVEAVVQATSRFVALLTDHISKEDDFLYPMALRRVPPRMLEKLPAAYAQLDREYREALAHASSRVAKVLGLNLPN